MKLNFFIPVCAVKIMSRRMPGSHRHGYAAYKSDGEQTSEKILGELNENMSKTLKESQKANEELIKLNQKFESEVKKLNEDAAAKGATVEQILEDVKELKAKSTRIIASTERSVKSVREEIANGFEKNFDKVKSSKFRFEIEQKSAGTMTAAANLTGEVVHTYSTVPAVRGRQAVHMRDLVSTIPSATGTWVFYRQNTPPGEGSFDFQTTHGNAKPQLDYDLTAVTVNAEFLAGYSRIARQMITDLPFLQTFVNNELVEDYLRTESFKFFDQMALGGGATGNSTTSASVTAEKVIDYVANLMQNNYQPNAIVVRPAVWATILKTKPQDYSVPGGVTISPSGDVMIVGIPLVSCTTNALPDNKILVGDWSKAAIIQTDGLSVGMFEQDQDNVIKNLITIRVESRVGFAILRPDAFVYGSA
jgi:HK97 family phage major capsid protein